MKREKSQTAIKGFSTWLQSIEIQTKFNYVIIKITLMLIKIVVELLIYLNLSTAHGQF